MTTALTEKQRELKRSRDKRYRDKKRVIDGVVGLLRDMGSSVSRVGADELLIDGKTQRFEYHRETSPEGTTTRVVIPDWD